MKIIGNWIYNFDRGLAYKKIRNGLYICSCRDTGIIEYVHTLPTYVKEFAETHQQQLV